MTHLLLTAENVQGWEFGMLQSLENEICRQTGAGTLVVRRSRCRRWLDRRFAQGTRYGALRPWLPRRPLALPADVDVLWLVLMGPEHYPLDVRRGWQGRARTAILYLFDTLPGQMKAIKRLFSDPAWDCCVTSFNDAVPLLERETGRRWHQVDQAVNLAEFHPPPAEGKRIHFSAYGRRHPRVHEAVLRFCAARGLYYDYTTHGRTQPTAEPLQLFRQYAWHLSHSLFTCCWPVEVTHPERAGALNPITCRWFEAAAAGAVVLGQAPGNLRFRELFGDNFVTPVNPDASMEAILKQLEHIWAQRAELSARALALRQKLGMELDWSARVKRMLALVAASRAGEGRRTVESPCASAQGKRR